METNQTEKKEWFRSSVPLLSLALAVSLIWGFTQYRARRNWEIRAENNYTKSFSELSAHVGDLETQLAKSMVSNSPPKLIEGFSDIWRQAYHAQEDLGQLPLTSVELSRTKDFLAKASAFSFSMAGQLMKGETLSQKEWSTLSDLNSQAKYFVRELRNLQGRMLENKEKWAPVDRINLSTAVDLSERLNTNKITKSFMMMEDGFQRLPDPEIEGNLLNFKPTPKGLTGPDLTVEEAREKALRFFEKDGKEYRTNYEGQVKGDYPVYLFRLTEEADKKKKEGSGVRIALSVKGGHPLWLLKERTASQEGDLSLQEAGEKARIFLTERGFPQMETVSLEEFQKVAVVNLASKREDILIYPEMIKVKVALDNGEVLGMEAVPYFTFYDPGRKIIPPRLTATEAQKKLNPHLKVEDTIKAVILNDLFQEVLCYESKGSMDKERFLVYTNASTGEEEKIKRIDEHGVEVE